MEINRQTVRISGFSPQLLLAMNIGDLHEIDWQEVGEDYFALKEGDTRSYESTLVTENGDTLPILVKAHPVQIGSEERLQWLFQDITERKELDQLRDDLTSMIYHDLRSPLANVISSLDVLKAMLPMEDKPQLQSLFDIATRSTERIQRLTKSLLDITRLEAGRPITDQETVSPIDIGRKACLALVPVARNKEQDISITVSEDLPPVYVDGDMIERVLINLLQNAIKYTPPGGSIEIGAHLEEEEICMWVKDTGPGVDANAKEAIFDKFTRLHAEEGGPKGIGLGLAFCRLAVEGHGGRIWVDDNPEGGAIFSFTLPLANANLETVG
ncbi:MAG: Sensor protein KdpD [Chloroflexi bacterium]|nr:Sensor protein KdpD [Chloroflexota bacterium]